jgi:hypothetical protein
LGLFMRRPFLRPSQEKAVIWLTSPICLAGRQQYLPIF